MPPQPQLVANVQHSLLAWFARHQRDLPWRHTRDRFFLWFALSFWIESANRVALGMLADGNEDTPVIYLFRLLAYALILLAIWQKNRPRA